MCIQFQVTFLPKEYVHIDAVNFADNMSVPQEYFFESRTFSCNRVFCGIIT